MCERITDGWSISFVRYYFFGSQKFGQQKRTTKSNTPPIPAARVINKLNQDNL